MEEAEGSQEFCDTCGRELLGRRSCIVCSPSPYEESEGGEEGGEEEMNEESEETEIDPDLQEVKEEEEDEEASRPSEEPPAQRTRCQPGHRVPGGLVERSFEAYDL